MSRGELDGFVDQPKVTIEIVLDSTPISTFPQLFFEENRGALQQPYRSVSARAITSTRADFNPPAAGVRFPLIRPELRRIVTLGKVCGEILLVPVPLT